MGFLGSTIFFLISSAVINVLNYLFLLLAARFLTTEAFGTFNSLVACLTLSTVAANTVQFGITKIVCEGHDFEGDKRRLLRKLTFWSAVAAVPSLCLLSPLADFLKAPVIDVLVMYGCVLAFVYASAANGVSAGLQRFVFQAVVNMAGTLLKLIAGAAAFAFGYGVGGGLLGYGLGSCLVFLLTVLRLNKDREPVSDQADPGSPADRRLSLSFISAYLLIVVPFAFDQVLVQSLSTAFSGYYGAAATLAKLAFFASLPVQTVVFPYLLKWRGDRPRQTKYFAAGLALSFVIALLVCAVLALYGRLVIVSLLTEKYLVVQPYILFFSLGMLAYICSYCLVNLLLARGAGWVWLPLLLTVGLQAVLFWTRRSSLAELIQNECLVYLVQLFLLLFCLGLSRIRARAGSPACRVELELS